ncbi:MAG: GatB/YqeY domain-containing protein [Henriciella sp.]|nr:GatB/YqeY domain-containing protein [Henriciella sp.]
MSKVVETDTVSLRDELNTALQKAEDDNPNSVEAQTLRLVMCAMTDRDAIARSRGECAGCDDAEIKKLLETIVAQREVSAREYDEAGRIADAERERQERDVVAAFLPKPLMGDILEAAVRRVVDELQASKLKDVSRCMSALRARYPGQIDCSSAGKAVRAALG